SDNITTGSVIKLMSPSSCTCPLRTYTNSSEKFYLLSTDVNKLVDRNGNYVYVLSVPYLFSCCMSVFFLQIFITKLMIT
ncbi:unnamed protein product, partial [Candidula unifasciata]